MDNTHLWEVLYLQSEFTGETLCNDCLHIYLENLIFHCCFLLCWSSLVAHRAPDGLDELISPPSDFPWKLLQLVAHTTASALWPEAFKETSLMRPGFLTEKKKSEGRNHFFKKIDLWVVRKVGSEGPLPSFFHMKIISEHRSKLSWWIQAGQKHGQVSPWLTHPCPGRAGPAQGCHLNPGAAFSWRAFCSNSCLKRSASLLILLIGVLS